jgi:hypothetical protein
MIAGCELSGNYSQDDITQWWLDNTKYHNREEFLQGNKENYILTARMANMWVQHIKHNDAPLLSYGGQLAKNLNRQLVSKAVSGSGMDRVLFQLLKYKDQIDWKNDLVIAELTPMYRYMTIELINHKNQQLALIDHYESSKYAPSPTTLDYLYEGILIRIKHEFPLVKIIDSGSTDETANYKHYIINKDINMSVLALKNKTNLIHTKYPGGHYVEDIHKQFADKLTDLFL